MPAPYTSLFSLTRILGPLRLGLRGLGFPPTVRERLPDNEHEHSIQEHPGQEGIAIHSHRALLGRLAADGWKPRHGRCDRKRERSYSGLSSVNGQNGFGARKTMVGWWGAIYLLFIGTRNRRFCCFLHIKIHWVRALGH